jgi:hypothetical protein
MNCKFLVWHSWEGPETAPGAYGFWRKTGAYGTCCKQFQFQFQLFKGEVLIVISPGGRIGAPAGEIGGHFSRYGALSPAGRNMSFEQGSVHYLYRDLAVFLLSPVFEQRLNKDFTGKKNKPKPCSFPSEPCTARRNTAQTPSTIHSTSCLSRRAGLLPPIVGKNRYVVSLRNVQPPTTPSSIASTTRPICLGANVPKRGPRKPEAGIGQRRRNKLPERRPSPPRSWGPRRRRLPMAA